MGADSVTFAALLNGGDVHRHPRLGMIVHEVGGRYMAMQIVGAPRLWERRILLTGKNAISQFVHCFFTKPACSPCATAKAKAARAVV